MHRQKGQSIIEYTVLAMLIIVGTIVMGPYVIRSIGGHFKLWQEVVDDSVNDRMKRIPISVSEQCRVSELQSSGCGAPLRQNVPVCGGAGLSLPAHNCAANERYYFQTGVPDGCYYCEGCKVDPTCCNVFSACISAPCCGKKPLPYPGFKRSNFLLDATGQETVELPSVDRNGNSTVNDVADTSIPINQSCYYGEMLLYNNCDNRRVRCQLNTKCNPNCIGNLPVNSLGTTTAHLCDPNPQNRLVQDEKVSWFNPCPPPPPNEHGQGGKDTSSMTVYYRATGAMELYESDEDWKQGSLVSVPFDGAQCDDTPEHLSTWETIFGVLGFGGSGTFECLFWVGPMFCYKSIPFPSPSPVMAFDHGYWGCTRSDDPKDMGWSSIFIQMVLDILFGFLGGYLTFGTAPLGLGIGFLTATILGSTFQLFDKVNHPDDDWNWNGCGKDLSYNRHSKQCTPRSGKDVYRTMNLDVTVGETKYLLAKIAEDSGQPFFTFAPFTGDHFGMFEVFVKSGGKYYCFKPTTNTYSRDSNHDANGLNVKDAAGDSCKYLVVHGSFEMDVNTELLRLEIPPGDDGDDLTPIRYNCAQCSGQCGPNPPACRAKCDTGYSEILVPDPDNPGNNIVTCLPCTDLKCNYTVDCKQGGLAGASGSFIGANCQNADTLIGCTDKGTGPGHGTNAIGSNGCYATSDYPTNRTAATNPTLYGCQLNCRKPAGTVTKCTD